MPKCPYNGLTASASSSDHKDPFRNGNVLKFIEFPDIQNIKISVMKLTGRQYNNFRLDCSSLYSFPEDKVNDCSL